MRFVLLLCVLFPTLAAAGAEPDAPDSLFEGWEFRITPYFWAAGLDGDVEGARNTSADIDMSFSDIWDDLDFGVLTALEARRGKFSVLTNAVYLKLSPRAGQPIGSLLPGAPPGDFSVRSTVQELIVELRPAWELFSLPLWSDESRIALDVGPGGRMFWMATHLDVKLDPGSPVGPFQRRFDERIIWVDLLAGARFRVQLTENLGLSVGGDYGGFDIGSSSHRTWSLAAFASYRLGEHWDLDAGWRTLTIERGPVDVDMAGPLVGASYRF
jgi:hypothetical protein